MDEKKLGEIKETTDLSQLDNLPETIEDITNNPILKPLLDFQKQAVVLVKEDKLEDEFLKKLKDDIGNDLNTGIYNRSPIVGKYKNLVQQYERMFLLYGRYTDLADEKIIEIKKIVEKYYISKKEVDKKINLLEGELEKTKEEIKKLKIELSVKKSKEEIKATQIPKIKTEEKGEIENEPEENLMDNRNDEEHKEDEDLDDFMSRKLPKKYTEKIPERGQGKPKKN